MLEKDGIELDNLPAKGLLFSRKPTILTVDEMKQKGQLGKVLVVDVLLGTCVNEKDLINVCKDITSYDSVSLNCLPVQLQSSIETFFNEYILISSACQVLPIALLEYML